MYRFAVLVNVFLLQQRHVHIWKPLPWPIAWRLHTVCPSAVGKHRYDWQPGQRVLHSTVVDTGVRIGKGECTCRLMLHPLHPFPYILYMVYECLDYLEGVCCHMIPEVKVLFCLVVAQGSVADDAEREERHLC